MKKILVALAFIGLIACSKNESHKLNKPISNEPITLKAKIINLDKNNLSVEKDSTTYTFKVDDINLDSFLVDDKVSIIYEDNTNKLISVILEERATFDDSPITLETSIAQGQVDTFIYIEGENEVLKLSSDQVQIPFEGPLIKGMKVKVTYTPTQAKDYDGIITKFDFLD